MNTIRYWLARKLLGVVVYAIVYTDGTEQVASNAHDAMTHAAKHTRHYGCVAYIINPAGQTVAIFSHGIYMEGSI